MEYIIYLEGLGREVTIAADSEQAACIAAYEQLTDAEACALVMMDCIGQSA